MNQKEQPEKNVEQETTQQLPPSKKPVKWYVYMIGIAIILVILVPIALVGGTIMQWFGFTYVSGGSIILFFIIVAVVGFPVELFAKGLPRALLSLDKISVMVARILYVVLDTIGTGISMAVVDYYMDSVSATDLSIFVISLVMALASVTDIGEKKKNHKDSA